MVGEEAIVRVHEMALAHRRQHLPRRPCFARALRVQSVAAGGNRAGRDDDDLVAASTQPRNLANERRYRIDVELIRARREQARAELGHDTLVVAASAFRSLGGH